MSLQHLAAVLIFTVIPVYIEVSHDDPEQASLVRQDLYVTHLAFTATCVIISSHEE